MNNLSELLVIIVYETTFRSSTLSHPLLFVKKLFVYLTEHGNKLRLHLFFSAFLLSVFILFFLLGTMENLQLLS